MPDIHINNPEFSGGVQNFGGQNTVHQTNNNTYYLGTLPRNQIDDGLTAVAATSTDPVRAQATVGEVKKELDRPQPGGLERIKTLFDHLSSISTDANAAAASLAALFLILKSHWPS